MHQREIKFALYRYKQFFRKIFRQRKQFFGKFSGRWSIFSEDCLKSFDI